MADDKEYREGEVPQRGAGEYDERSGYGREGYAEQQGPERRGQEMQGPERRVATMTPGRLYGANALDGRNVINTRGDHLGEIEEVVIDPAKG